MNDPQANILCQLREEYIKLLPQAKKTIEFLTTTVNHLLKDIYLKLGPEEQIQCKSRIKSQESSIAALARRQEGQIFDPAKQYSLSNLPDFVGLRILVFPNPRISEIQNSLQDLLKNWKSDPVRDMDTVHKYFGHLPEPEISEISCEVQIVPMLIGLFWQVEHSTLYKPSPRIKNLESEGLNRAADGVYAAIGPRFP